MKVQIINRDDNAAEVIEWSQLPSEGETVIGRNGKELQVLRVVHTPFDPNNAAKIVVGTRGSLGSM